MEYIGKIIEKDINIKDISILNLAFLGDAAWELIVRNYFIKENMSSDKLSKTVKKYVNAKKQNEIYLKIYDNLNEEEKNIAKRARNSKIRSFPKSCSCIEYRNATAFEALIGYYLINDEIFKIKEILKKYIEGAKE